MGRPCGGGSFSKGSTKSLPPRTIKADAIEIPFERLPVPEAQTPKGGDHGGAICALEDERVHANFLLAAGGGCPDHGGCRCRRGFLRRRRQRGPDKFLVGTIIILHNDVVGTFHQDLHEHGQHSGSVKEWKLLFGYTVFIFKNTQASEAVATIENQTGLQCDQPGPETIYSTGRQLIMDAIIQ